MDVLMQSGAPIRGEECVPPDKAIGQRAILLAAVAEGATSIHPWPSGEDCRAARRLIQQLGVPVQPSASMVRIEGGGARALRPPLEDLACGESGTTFRLAAGLLAGQPWTTRLCAGPSLSRRPMKRIIEPLTRMGARIDAASGSSGSVECYPPLTIHGRVPLRAIRYPMPLASAQVKSAVLLAGLSADGPTTVIEPQPTRDHTERLLRACGMTVHSAGNEVTVEPGLPRSPGAFEVPGDVSSAAFFLVGALCVPGSLITLRGVGLNPTRITYLDVLRRMGAAIEVSVETQARSWEPRGTLIARACSLQGVTIAAADVPGLIDELPILMVAASRARGVTRFEGVGELRVKETDRVQSMVAGLGRLGARIRVLDPETVEIAGGPLRGAEVESAGDHRTAMSLAIAGLAADGRTHVRGAECVAKSFPGFFDALRRVAGSTTVKTVDKV